MCSFCLRAADEVDQLIAGPGICVCSDCVQRCVRILQEGTGPTGETVVSWAGLDDDAMLARLPRMARVADQVESSMAEWVGVLRRRGVTWERVGAALRMTRQSAWMRFADRA